MRNRNTKNLTKLEKEVLDTYGFVNNSLVKQYKKTRERQEAERERIMKQRSKSL